MLPGPNDVTAAFTTHLVLSDTRTTDLGVELGYRVSDPYAVQARFTQDGGPVSTWLLARDLLAKGLVATQVAPAGQGHVSIWRDEDPDFLLIMLRGGEGEALLAAPAEPVERFMQATRTLVPLGAESDLFDASVDAFVTAVLVA